MSLLYSKSNDNNVIFIYILNKVIYILSLSGHLILRLFLSNSTVFLTLLTLHFDLVLPSSSLYFPPPISGKTAETVFYHPSRFLQSRNRYYHPSGILQSRNRYYHPSGILQSRNRYYHPSGVLQSRNRYYHPSGILQSSNWLLPPQWVLIVQ